MLSKEKLSKEDLSASFKQQSCGYSYGQNQEGLGKYSVKTLVVAGGVTANKGLERTSQRQNHRCQVIIPAPLWRHYCRYDCHINSGGEWNKKTSELGP